MQVDGPIGVFDSGVGGLAVLREIRRELPGEDLLYVADTGHAPYGDKSNQQIVERSTAISEFLLNHDAKAIVVACNTATSAAVKTLRSRFSVPIIAMEPAVKPASAHTRSGVIGVLATSRTIASENVAQLHKRYGADVKILLKACPGLVEKVEAGNLSGTATRALLEQYLLPLLAEGADTLVLGCTHYPFLASLIQEIVGPSVAIIDPSPAIAREVHRRLMVADMLSDRVRPGIEQFWSSAASDHARGVIETLWDEKVSLLALPS